MPPWQAQKAMPSRKERRPSNVTVQLLLQLLYQHCYYGYYSIYSYSCNYFLLFFRDDAKNSEQGPAAKRARLDVAPADLLAAGVGLPDLLKAQVTEVSNKLLRSVTSY